VGGTIISRNGLISVYVIFALVTGGFIGLLIYDGVVDEAGVEAATWVVDINGGGNHTKIQYAIDNSSAFDTIYVWAGEYRENIKIGRSVTLIGNGSSDTIINASSGDAVMNINAEGVKISGFSMIKASGNSIKYGAFLDYAMNVTIENCRFLNLSRDIYLRYGNNNTIVNNSCQSYFRGISLDHSPYNLIRNNTCLEKYYYGIELFYSDNNQVLENSCSSTRNEGINVEYSKNNYFMANNISNSIFYGIHLYYSTFNTITDNQINDNYYYGVYIERSSDNTIINNTCFINRYTGIYIYYSSNRNLVDNNTIEGIGDGIELFSYSNDNTVSNNTIIDQKYTGINVRTCERNTFTNNTFVSCGFNFEGNNLYQFRSHEVDLNNTANGRPIYFWKDEANKTVPAGAAQAILVNCTGITVEHQNLSAATNSIMLAYSNNSLLINNTCNNNGQKGINLFESNSNEILNNTGKQNYYGLYLKRSDGNTLRKNFLRDNIFYGIYLESCEYIDVIENICINNSDGIFAQGGPRHTLIENNTCNYNRRDGIEMFASFENTTVKNNVCKYNTHDGLRLSLYEGRVLNNVCSNNNWSGLMINGNFIVISNNEATNNNHSGLRIITHDSTVKNNNFEYNKDAGLLLDGLVIFDAYSTNNDIYDNDISNNVNGIRINLSDINWLYDNHVSSNTGYGVLIESTSRNSQIYHNDFLFNTQGCKDNGVNYFNNSVQEGNYWSDYAGLDNGAGGRKAGDGIGDTNIPHLGSDNYPYLYASGWKLPSRPYMYDPGDISIDGNYTLEWDSNDLTTGYILEESNEVSFQSPVVHYTGSGKSYSVNYKSDGTFYYRVRGFNGPIQTGWSGIVDIIVDLKPNPPSNLITKDITGSTITLKWSAPLDTDIQGYHIWMSNTNPPTPESFNRIDTVSSTEVQYTVSGLKDSTKYFFYIIAFDNYSNSTFSNIISATTMDTTPPGAPAGFIAEPVTDTEIRLNWNENLEPDLDAYIIYMNKTDSGPFDEFVMVEQLPNTEISYTVRGLSEQTKYHFKIKALDKVPNYSKFSEVASATTPDITPPSKPTGLKIVNNGSDSLSLNWNENPEHDVIGYYLYRSQEEHSGFFLLLLNPINQTDYTDTDLKGNTMYYYKVKAVDDVGLVSPQSDIVSGRTFIIYKTPEINVRPSDFQIFEDSYNDARINLHNWFRELDDLALNFSCKDNNNISVTIHQANGTVVLIPKRDWNGKEDLIFTAENPAGLKISDSVNVLVKGINDAPGQPEITAPANGTEIYAGQRLNFSGICSDADIPYGDVLRYNWYSNISGLLGNGQVLTNVSLPSGLHLITLKVNDLQEVLVEAEVTIQVIEPDVDIEEEDPDGKKNQNDGDYIALLIAVISIVFIIIILILIMLIHKRNKYPDEGPRQPLMKTKPATEGESPEDLRYIGMTKRPEQPQRVADKPHTPSPSLPPVETPPMQLTEAHREEEKEDEG
jgi:parallel beta-helix repeat protein